MLLLLLVCALPAHAAETPADPNHFVLGAGDVLLVTVWKDPELTREVLVRPDGKISFPLIDDIDAAGRTVSDLRGDIQERIKEFVPGSPVSVILTKLLSRKVYVMGKVMHPGVFLMDGNMTVVQALALAGGLTPYSSEGRILVLRRDTDGKDQALPFDYGDLAKGSGMEQNVLLRPDDTIIVP